MDPDTFWAAAVAIVCVFLIAAILLILAVFQL
jgi:hypothetical protein